MKSLHLLQRLSRQLKLNRLWRRRPARTRLPRAGPATDQDVVRHVPVWLGTQLTPFPVVLKSGKRRLTLYDDWD